MATKTRMTVCWVLLGSMAGLVLILVSPLRNLLHIQGDLSNFDIYMAALGVALVILAIITRMSRMLKIFLIVAGASSAGWIIGVSLHNLLFRFFPTESVTYVLVFFVLPVTFLVCVLGATVIGIQQLFTSK